MKLVRDRIGDIPWPDTYHGEPCGDQAKQHLGWVAPDSPEYRELLRLKLFEEAGELADADRRGDRRDVLDEAADVYEVLRALLVANGVCPPVEPANGRTPPRRVDEVLYQAAHVKLGHRGGFFRGRTYDGPVRADHPAAAIPSRLVDHRLQRERERTCRLDGGHCPHPTRSVPDLVGDIDPGSWTRCCRCAGWLPARRCTCPVDPDGPERGDPLSTCHVHGWTAPENTPAGPPSASVAGEPAPEVLPDAPNAPGGAQRLVAVADGKPGCPREDWLDGVYRVRCGFGGIGDRCWKHGKFETRMEGEGVGTS
jgi:hypothetical protein